MHTSEHPRFLGILNLSRVRYYPSSSSSRIPHSPHGSSFLSSELARRARTSPIVLDKSPNSNEDPKEIRRIVIIRDPDSASGIDGNQGRIFILGSIEGFVQLSFGVCSGEGCHNSQRPADSMIA